MPKSHLVPKQIVDRNGRVTTVYVNPDKTGSVGNIPETTLVSPPSSSANGLTQYINKPLSGKDLGLESLYLLSDVDIGEQDENGMSHVGVAVDLESKWWTDRFLEDSKKRGGDKDNANYYVARALGSNFQEILKSRYGNFEPIDSLEGEGLRAVLSLEVDPGHTTLEDLESMIWNDTPLVRMQDDFESGVSGEDLNELVYKLADVEGGGDFRLLEQYDLLSSGPTFEDIMEVESTNPPLEGPNRQEELYERALAVSKDKIFGRAYEEGVEIPADYEKAFESEWEQEREVFENLHSFASDRLAIARENNDIEGVSKREKQVEDLSRALNTRGRSSPVTVKRVRSLVEEDRKQKIDALFEEYGKNSSS